MTSEMSNSHEMPFGERLNLLLAHFGISQAHFAASPMSDVRQIVVPLADRIASLTLVSSQGFSPDPVKDIQSNLLIVTGDSGPFFGPVHNSISQIPDAHHYVLKGYEGYGWDDVANDRTEELTSTMLDHLSKSSTKPEAISPMEEEGEIAGLTYRVRGSGPPLILFPLALTASQWDPIIENIRNRYCIIVLGGAHVGMVQNLEFRATGGYRPLVRNLFEDLNFQPGDSVLDVGCGSGAHDRYLISRVDNLASFVAIDHSPFMIREATSIARSHGLETAIEFKEGNAEELPFPDNCFDVVFSITVMEEVDANKMLSELVRVTKPGGRVGVVVRAVDMPGILNLPIASDLKRKLEAPGRQGGSIGKGGCADSSLYSKFHHEGLTNLKMFPQFAIHDSGPQFENQRTLARASLTLDEVKDWDTAYAHSESEGTFFVGQPFHCAIGTKS